MDRAEITALRERVEALRERWAVRREAFEIIGDDATAQLISAFISDLYPLTRAALEATDARP